MEEKYLYTDNNQRLIYHSLGIVQYKEVWDYQEQLFSQLIEEKEREMLPMSHHLIFCQHPHVYTLGKSGNQNNLLLNFIQLKAKHAEFFKIDRGGDITYHGPGQLVGYPVLSLQHLKIGVREYIYLLEEVIIKSLQNFDIKGERLEGATGVWIDTANPMKTRKICAIGVRCSHWVTMHGFALNVNTDLSYFDYINPCGFTDKSVTSIEKELQQKADFEAVSDIVLNQFLHIFGFNIS
jgi:lipoyl(octanoyl) transferase